MESVVLTGNQYRPEEELLNVIQMVINSRATNRSVLLGDDEDLSDNDLFDRLTSGGRVRTFETTNNFKYWRMRRHALAGEFRAGRFSSETLSRLVLDDIRLWRTEVLPQIHDLDFGPRNRRRIELLQQPWNQVLEDINSYDWGRTTAALVYACDRRERMFDVFARQAVTSTWKCSFGLEECLGVIEDHSFNIPGELFVHTTDLVMSRDDQALLIGIEYDLCRPFPEPLLAWKEVVQLSQTCINQRPELPWAARLDYLLKAVALLAPYHSEALVSTHLTTCLRKAGRWRRYGEVYSD